MLARANRVTSPEEFRRILRRGRRLGGTLVVTHVLRTEEVAVRIGFVVGRAVGNAVVRNRVKRRLRAIGRELVPELPEGTAIVVRALPAAGSGAYSALHAEVRGSLTRSGALQ